MKKSLFISLLFCVSFMSHAYYGDPKQQVSHFFTELGKGEISQAVDNLYASNPLAAQKSQELTLLKQQLGSIEPLYGKFLGSEDMHYEVISDSVVRVVRMAKYEQHPVTWEFYFYKPKKTWMISQALFVDQFQVVDLKK
ncbi:hypothetical protein [Shewanella surugensis]|uniref:DUF3887 domain-containing protein n=1 Tax=Shewanella surugensis TaxID=212020 RepID=A0ABT0LK61_9GAMM|nr:hypothetical protein [Shewanella surugensis]MCL1127765.1 hypothetical protein [Shewanella surugensis]